LPSRTCERRLDHDTAAIWITTRLPERHPILADVLSLDAVRRLLAEGRSQVLGYLRLPAKFEGDAPLAFRVDDA
jgi:hypothetical protein